MTMSIKPRIFIGSSSEALPLARAVAGWLKPRFQPVLWDLDVFVPGTFTIDQLLGEVQKCHLALFVFSKDDVLSFRGRSYKAARDNVVFELGLFMSRLGRTGCLFLAPRSKTPFRIPSDLSGLQYIPYDADATKKPAKGKLESAKAELLNAFSKLSQGDGTRVSLSGEWTESWSSSKKRYGSHAQILHVGDKLYAKTEARGRVYIVEGNVEHGDLVTGRWYDQQQGSTYFGTFQLRLDGRAQKMEGQWIGFSSKTRKIKTGPWTWLRRKESPI